MKNIPHLTNTEAAKRLSEFGPNVLTETSSTSPVGMFIDQFRNTLVILLIVAALLSFLLGDSLDGILILSIIILNSLLGFFQEYKAEKALESLKKMTTGVVKVLRDNIVIELPSTNLVPGDIIFLEEGDKVPSDAEIIESMHAEVNEATLTGESLPVEKNATQETSLFMGTIITRGRATARVTKTGMHTKFGAIATKLGQIKDEETPLEKKMKKLGGQLGIVALVAATIILVISLLRNNPIFESILTAISLAVAAVPEGLPAVVTIALAVGTQRMAKQRAILRKLSAIESLGSITVIATDKTGTLTQNDMRVVDVWHKGVPIAELIRVGVRCNNASLSIPVESGSPQVIGDKTEGALLLLAHDLKYDTNEIKTNGELLEEFAFTSALKRMSVIWKEGQKTTVLTKGAPEAVLAHCILSDSKRQKIERAFRDYAAQGLRVIALASRSIVWKKQSRESVESKLTFLGFVGIADPTRPEILPAVKKAQKAGITTLMITGDNELTAKAIASEVGILHSGNTVLTGTQLEELNDQELIRALQTARVFARTTPEQKYRVVKILQNMGHVVAVTGDGVNDALALKQADVGVAMGITGTDVAKEASDMIITDDNYASLVSAIEEGRTIFDNIKSATKYLIGCNLGEIGSITIGVLFGWPFILSPLHILYVNLVTDGLPAIGLALTPKQGDIMTRAPRTDTSMFNRHDVLWFIEVATLTTFATLASFILGSRVDVTLGRTLAFLALILAQQYIFYDIAARNKTILKLSFRHFPWAVLPIVIMIIQVLLLEVPLFTHLFTITAPPIAFSLASVSITSLLLITSELRKKFGRHLYFHH